MWNRAEEDDNREALETLDELGLPPYEAYTAASNMVKLRKWLAYYGGSVYDLSKPSFSWEEAREKVTEYSSEDFDRSKDGFYRVLPELWDEFLKFNLYESVPEVEVPVYFFLGRHDWMVPSVSAAEYYEYLQAPEKGLVWFEYSGHQPIYEQPDDFMIALTNVLTHHR